MSSRLEEYLSKSEEEKGKGFNLEEETSIRKSYAEQEIENIKQDRKERKKYAKYTFFFLCTFTLFVFLIIISSGAKCLIFSLPFYLSDAVLITLITTSFATVVGIFVIVMKYLFPSKNNH